MKHLFLIIVFFISGCVDFPVEPKICNPKDCNSDCYIPIPSAIPERYNDSSIIITFLDYMNECGDSIVLDLDISLVESINLTRYKDNIMDTAYNILYSSDIGHIIDILGTFGSQDMHIYYYDLNFIKKTGESNKFSSQPIVFFIPQIGKENININRHEISQIRLEWDYPYGDYFKEPIDSIKFEINKYINEIIDETILLPIIYSSETNTYEYFDNIELGDNIQYGIRLLMFTNQTQETMSEERTFNFPSYNLDWIPYNSESILLYWTTDDTDFVNLIDEIRINSNISGFNQVILGASSIAQYLSYPGNYLDDLEFITTTDFIYYISRCSLGNENCLIDTIKTRTFPIHHMQYVPGGDAFIIDSDLDNNIYNVDAFYIDIYEIDSLKYNTPSVNTLDLSDARPITNVSITQARIFCDLRTDELLANFDTNFRLPTESEWEIAASCGKNDELSLDCSYRYIYPEQVDQCPGCITCEYVNYSGSDEFCSNSLLPIGAHNGQYAVYENATSPLGLFDMCGNAAEWVEQVRFDGFSMSRGGSYQDGDTKTTDYHILVDESNNSSRSTIGFRTVISATDIIEDIKEYLKE